MQLSTYLAQKRVTVAEMARALNVPHATALHWTKPIGSPEFRVPRPGAMAKIVAWSGGAVTAASFYPAPPANGVRPDAALREDAA